MDLNNKVAIVTGGGRGIGKSYVNALLEQGVKVCIADVNEVAAREAVQELSQAYKSCVIFVKCDVTDRESFENCFRETISAFGKLDILVNNAGILDENNWRRMIDINLVGVIQGIKLAFEYMSKDKGKDGGFVINTASDAGLRPYHMVPLYSSTKYGVVGATKNFGNDFYFKKHGIIVGSICPGPVDTMMFSNFSDTASDRDGANDLMKTVVMIRPEILGKALIQILKDGINGALLHIGEDSVFNYVQ